MIFLNYIKNRGGNMITGEIKNKVDKMWEYFWTGGLTNPVDVIEKKMKLVQYLETLKKNLFFLLMNKI